MQFGKKKVMKQDSIYLVEGVVYVGHTQNAMITVITHCDSGEELWLQREAAFKTHSFRDAEPQPVIFLNEKKIIKCLPSSQTRPALTCRYLAQYSKAVVSVTLETVNLDLD